MPLTPTGLMDYHSLVSYYGLTLSFEGYMALRKYSNTGNATPVNIKSLTFSSKENGKANEANLQKRPTEADVDIDLREVYFLIMHFLSAGPCHRTYGQFWNELLEHQLLPRRYHAWYSRSGMHSGDENDDGMSFPLSYNKLVERHPHVEKDHLVKLLKQLMLSATAPSRGLTGGNVLNAATVPTLLGTGSFSLLAIPLEVSDSSLAQGDQNDRDHKDIHPPSYMRWPHRLADQVLVSCYMHSNLVLYMQTLSLISACNQAIFDRSGRYVITGSDDRLVKIWSMETAYCLASCRGHEGDITDLAVNFNNTLVASASNDCVIRVTYVLDVHPFNPRIAMSAGYDGKTIVWDGHEEYISYINSRNLGPWETIKRNIRAVEFCRVEDLEYSTHPGSGESCCKMTLKFVDPSSEVLGKSFKLTLPEVTGFPDFLVEKSRYDASMARNWTSRDKCQVWWKNEGEEDGSWWEGRILSVKPNLLNFQIVRGRGML
ncbi:UNVERIFIED_CONTAM: Bromodomain and WD repeat-containing DDB [Sesamum radiatum]|uniref:Bromodomain and WD repeat-containing DDB n=1 Tax=Sesamum radiatum TaxID=300843 RepID=A0AAW2S982_SESRA